MVHAWGKANEMCLGQVITDKKSKEITAIPKLLESLAIKGCLGTIDAMACQKEIAQKILVKGGDYCLCVKGNQRNLHADISNQVADRFDAKLSKRKVSLYETQVKGHGREEKRYNYVFGIPKGFREASKWPGLEAIGVVINETKRDGRMTNQVRYSFLTRKMKAKEFGQAMRGHWGIENQLHWQLDVSYQEDKCRVRQGHADANLAIIRRLTLNMLKANKTEKMGIKNKRLFAGWDMNYCEVVLAG